MPDNSQTPRERRAKRQPRVEKLGWVDYSIRFHYPSGVLKFELILFGDSVEDYQCTAYFPNGRINVVETGKTDKLIAYLHELKASRVHPGSPA